jgi:hypothetical protein
VQEYTDGFRKMALMLDIPLHTQETLMKYIGGLPAHIRNIVFMFGPTNLDEVSVQATYIEAGKAGVSGESSSRKEDKRKWHGKNSNAVARKEEKPSCKHCKKEGHDEDVVGSCILRRGQSGSRKRREGKQLQRQQDPQTWDRIQVMNLRSHWLV